MDKLKQVNMILKIMWWRRFNDLRKLRIEARQLRNQLKTIKLYEYINNNKNVYSKAKSLNDNILNYDIDKLEEEIGTIRNSNTNL